MAPDMNRRKFLESAAASAAAFTIVPRHVLGGPGFVPPSDKITLAHIGFGTQSIREVGSLLASPEIQRSEADGNDALESLRSDGLHGI